MALNANNQRKVFSFVRIMTTPRFTVLTSAGAELKGSTRSSFLLGEVLPGVRPAVGAGHDSPRHVGERTWQFLHRREFPATERGRTMGPVRGLCLLPRRRGLSRLLDPRGRVPACSERMMGTGAPETRHVMLGTYDLLGPVNPIY